MDGDSFVMRSVPGAGSDRVRAQQATLDREGTRSLPLSVLTSLYSTTKPASVAPIASREFNRASNDRRKTWELPNPRKDWRRRAGNSLQGDRHQAGTPGRRQGFTAGTDRPTMQTP